MKKYTLSLRKDIEINMEYKLNALRNSTIKRSNYKH